MKLLPFKKKLAPGIKPTSLVKVDPHNPLAKGLVAGWWNSNNKYQPLLHSLLAGTAPFKAGALSFDGTSASTASTGVAVGIGHTDKITIVADFIVHTHDQTDDLLFELSDNANNYRNTCMVDYNPGTVGKVQLVLYGADIADFNIVRIDKPAINERHTLIITMDRTLTTNAIRAWVDGVEQSRTIAQADLPVGNFRDDVVYLCNRGGISLFLESELYSYSIYDRILLDSEAESLGRDPYQILKPVNEPIYFIPPEIENIVQFSVSNNQLLGLDFTPIEITSFSVSNNELLGLDFLQQEITTFNISNNELLGLDFLQQETTQFSIANNKLIGIDFTQSEQVQFSLSENQLLGLSFDLLELTQFIESENLLTGISFSLAGTEVVPFNIASNELQGLNFLQYEVSTFGFGENLLEGLSFNSSYITEFNISENLLNGINFSISGEQSIEFSVSDNQLEGTQSSYIEISSQLISNNELLGLDFLQKEVSQFNIGINELIGLDFLSRNEVNFNISDNQLQGIQFDLLEIDFIFFNVSDNQLLGLDFLIDQPSIPRDQVRFSVLIQRDLQQVSNIRRTLRNKVEL